MLPRVLLCLQDGCTALMLAARSGSPRMVATMVAVDGIDVNVQDNVCGCPSRCWHAEMHAAAGAREPVPQCCGRVPRSTQRERELVMSACMHGCRCVCRTAARH